MTGIRRDNLDKLFSHWVRARAGWACECCHKSDGQMDCAHIIGRRNRQTRWDDANAICLCRGCHSFFTDNPLDWSEWIVGYLGSDHVEAVRQRAQSTDKLTQDDKDAIADELYAKIQWIGETPVCTGKKRAKNKASAKKTANKKGRKLSDDKLKRKVNGKTVRRNKEGK